MFNPNVHESAKLTRYVENTKKRQHMVRDSLFNIVDFSFSHLKQEYISSVKIKAIR